MLPTHYDLAVILAVSFGFQVAGLIFIASLVWRAWREVRRDATEGQRLARVVGVLILQEAEKIRALVRDMRTS
jgi:hypothetical protein